MAAQFLTNKQVEYLTKEAIGVRRDVLTWAHNHQETSFHIGGAVSMNELVVTLLLKVMHTGYDGTPWESRDRLILSKAHASIGLYPVLLRAGYLSQEDIDQGFLGPDALLFKHPEVDRDRGVETSGGSLGMGLGYAAGLALAARRRASFKQIPARVYCIVGDGECNEGSIWEAAELAAHMHLDNLCVIVDANGLQLDDFTCNVLDMGSLAQKFEAFGFDVAQVDGHNIQEIYTALTGFYVDASNASDASDTSNVQNPSLGDLSAKLKDNPRPKDILAKPKALIAHTIKGKGFLFAQNDPLWHDGIITDDLYEKGIRDLGARGEL